MAPLDFEILSKLMSYVFTFLGVVIVLRSFRWLRKDQKATAKRLKHLPDAGTIGLLTVLRGSSELPEGETIPVPVQGVLGFVRTCDIVVPVTDVVAQHLDFTFRDGKGLFIYPRRGCPAAVDGVTIDSRADSRRYPMRHGSVLQVGEALLQLGVFAGLNVRETTGVWEEALPEATPAPMPPEPVAPYTGPAAPPSYSAYPYYAPAAPVAPQEPAAPYPPGTAQPSPYGAQPPYTPVQGYPQNIPYPPQPMTPPERRPGHEA